MAVKTTVLPKEEALTLKSVKAWLKIHPDIIEDDALIRSLIKSARVWAQDVTTIRLLTQTVEEVFDYNSGCLELTCFPVQSVTSLTYANDDGTTTTINTSEYTVDTFSYPSRVVFSSFSPNQYIASKSIPNRWKVTYICGHTSELFVPDTIKTAMLLYIGFYYENREDIPISKGSNDPHLRSAFALLSLSRLNRI